MKTFMKVKRKTIVLILAVLMASAGTGFIVYQRQIKAEAHWQETQEHMAQEVLRFHVLANSDSDADQALKMKVKEQILNLMKKGLPENADLNETKKWVTDNHSELKKTGQRVIKEEGYSYPITVALTTCYFPDKTYGDVTFPAGDYEALRIEIGEAKGQNWWCVLYPNLCFIDATHAVVPDEGKEELKAVLSSEEYEMVTATSDFKIKWFFLEGN